MRTGEGVTSGYWNSKGVGTAGQMLSLLKIIIFICPCVVKMMECLDWSVTVISGSEDHSPCKPPTSDNKLHVCSSRYDVIFLRVDIHIDSVSI